MVTIITNTSHDDKKKKLIMMQLPIMATHIIRVSECEPELE